MDMKQHHLRQGDTRTICWLPLDRRVKVGSRLEVKELEGVWTVEAIYGPVTPKSQLHQRWPVGGLF